MIQTITAIHLLFFFNSLLFISSPPQGYSVITKFKLVCQEWTDTDSVLNYHFYYDNGNIQKMNLNSTTHSSYPILNAKTVDQASLMNFRLGPGDKNNNYTVAIYVLVSGIYKAYREYKNLFVQVCCFSFLFF